MVVNYCDDLVKSQFPSSLSFLRKQKTSYFNGLWTPVFTGVTDSELFTMHHLLSVIFGFYKFNVNIYSPPRNMIFIFSSFRKITCKGMIFFAFLQRIVYKEIKLCRRESFLNARETRREFYQLLCAFFLGCSPFRVCS